MRADGATTAISDAAARLVEDVVAVVLAGGEGARLGPLTRHECKPALPFAGFYRNIDFSLSNCVNSGIQRIGVPTQYRDASLVRHLAGAWHAGSKRSRALQIDVWRASRLGVNEVYRGTADAVHRNWHAIEACGRSLVLVLAGDHVYRMDYRPMLREHMVSEAPVTVGCVEVPIAEASQLGVMTVDRGNRIRRFEEKPRRPEPVPGRAGRALGSMGIYVFDRDFLGGVLRADASSVSSTHDFGRDLIPALVDEVWLHAFAFSGTAAVGGGYWRDVGTIAAYWRAHMELLDGIPGSDLADDAWPMLPLDDTGHAHRTRCLDAVRQSGSLLVHDCRTNGATVRRSVVFGGVRVGRRSELRNAVLLPRVNIGPDCRLTNVIVDRGVDVPPGTVVEAAPHRFGIVEPAVLTAETDFAALAETRAPWCSSGRSPAQHRPADGVDGPSQVRCS